MESPTSLWPILELQLLAAETPNAFSSYSHRLGPPLLAGRFARVSSICLFNRLIPSTPGLLSRPCALADRYLPTTNKIKLQPSLSRKHPLPPASSRLMLSIAVSRDLVPQPANSTGQDCSCAVCRGRPTRDLLFCRPKLLRHDHQSPSSY